MTIRRAIFRADASPGIGGGHVMRCLALADGLATAGWTCAFAIGPGTLVTVPRLAASGFEIFELSGTAEAIAERAGRADLVVVDHYGLGADFERRCRGSGALVMAIDDLANRPHAADVLLDQTYGRTAADYKPHVEPNCRLLLGTEYALLRCEFAQLRTAALARRSAEPRRVLVSMGYWDPYDITCRALDALAGSALVSGGVIDVTLGRASPNADAVLALARQLGPKCRVHFDASNMAALMCQADVAVGAAGTTSWERCVLALPTFVVITADNQRMIAEQLESAGAICVAGCWHDADIGRRLSKALESAASDVEILRSMSRAAAGVCDGRGVERTVDAITSLVAQAQRPN